jgi:hypothetical protein
MLYDNERTLPVLVGDLIVSTRYECAYHVLHIERSVFIALSIDRGSVKIEDWRIDREHLYRSVWLEAGWHFV